MKLASYNVENLFCRVKAMNQETLEEGKDVLLQYSRLNAILAKAQYTSHDKEAILDALDKLGLNRSDESEFALLRQNKGQLLKRSRGGGSPSVVADGRGDWIGWLELKTEPVNEKATRMTAKVIADLQADVLAVVEAEDRIALKKFGDQLLKPMDAAFGNIMLIDGNDERGIDVGVMCKGGCMLNEMVSHVDDLADGRPVFSRDCPEYTIQVDDSHRVLLLINHFKSKGYGSPAASSARRRAQAARVREIYDARRQAGVRDIAIVGDLNDTPDSAALEPLLSEGSDLKDIGEHRNFQSDGRKGTYGTGAASNKIDYILLSPSLFDRVSGGGIFRKGVWGGKNGTLFEHYEEMISSSDAASDHAAIWAEIDL